MIDGKKFVEDIYSHVELTDFQKVQIGKLYDKQPKTDWIPCEERLPEDLEDVLVWFEYFRYGEYNRLFQTIGVSYTVDGKWSNFVNGSSGWKQLKIIAWQPLPKPYKKEGAE